MKKTIRIQGYFCSNPHCDYYLIDDETIHALVGDGTHGKYEHIQDLRCQSCRKKFTVRRHTVLYRLKTEHLFWWLAYYHFVRPHESLKVKLEKPLERKGKQRPTLYRQMTPALAARWLLSLSKHSRPGAGHVWS